MSGDNPIYRPTGLLGGTFDPIHFGHLRMAEELADALVLDELRFVPAANPPHRPQPDTPANHRAEMARLALAGNPKFILDECELQRSGTSYSIDTVLALNSQLGETTAICLIMGSDAFAGLDTWHRWTELLNHCHLILVERPNAPLQHKLPAVLQTLLRHHLTEDPAALSRTKSGVIVTQAITALDISATAIREYLRKRQSPRYLLPDSVLDYIQCHRLYGSNVI